jgi:hypothetical protein
LKVYERLMFAVAAALSLSGCAGVSRDDNRAYDSNGTVRVVQPPPNGWPRYDKAEEGGGGLR